MNAQWPRRPNCPARATIWNDGVRPLLPQVEQLCTRSSNGPRGKVNGLNLPGLFACRIDLAMEHLQHAFDLQRQDLLVPTADQRRAWLNQLWSAIDAHQEALVSVAQGSETAEEVLLHEVFLKNKSASRGNICAAG